MPKYEILIEDNDTTVWARPLQQEVADRANEKRMIDVAAGLEQFLPYLATGNMKVTVYKDGVKVHG